MGHIPLKYEIELQIENKKLNDINSFIIMRCPLQHTASYAIVDVMVDLTLYNNLSFMINQHQFPDVIFDAYVVDTNKQSTGNIGERVRHLAQKNYKCIFIESGESPVLSNSYMQCILYFVNPILYYLNNGNSYNIILKNITAIDMIKAYEKHLKTTFARASFDFIKIGENINCNPFKYEQILIKLKNDLLIPSWIIQNYKPFSSYAFYFHDDFKIDEKSKAEITPYLINLSDKNSFPKIESLLDPKYADVIVGNTFIDMKSIGDRFEQIGQKKPSIVIKTSNFQFKYKKANVNSDVPAASISETSVQEIEVNRNINSIKPNIFKRSTTPTEETIIYAPDSVNTAVTRFHNVRKQLTTDLESINTFYMRDAHIDFLQFGKLYNINPIIPHEYVYTPINIVNCFIRDSGRVPILVHNVKYQMLKFKGNE